MFNELEDSVSAVFLVEVQTSALEPSIMLWYWVSRATLIVWRIPQVNGT